MTSGTSLNRMKITGSTFNSDEDEEWITVNGARVKVENGELQGEVGGNIAEKETTKSFSASGANPDILEMSESAQRRHQKHLRPGKSYPGMSMDEYVEKSSALARSPVGGDVLGYQAEDGSIVRYNKMTNDWVRAHNAGVVTMFKPKRKEAYYNENMIEDGGAVDD